MDNFLDFNFQPLPTEMYLDGVLWNGKFAFVNGYNGYEATIEHGFCCAIINNSCWVDGKANLLTTKDGLLIKSTNRV